MASRQIDWEAIEREYRAGCLSIKEIARRYGVSDAGILKRAKAAGWARDLSDAVRVATRTRAVSGSVSGSDSRKPLTETEIVEAAATRGAKAIEGHLTRADRLKRMADRMADQLEMYLGGQPTTVEIFVAKGDGPATVLRTLGDVAERIQRLERQALNLDEPADTGSAVKVTIQAEPLTAEQWQATYGTTDA